MQPNAVPRTRADRDARRQERALAVPTAAKAANHTGVMVALFLPTQVADRLHVIVRDAGLNAEPADILHLTLVYPGNTEDLADKQAQIAEFCALFAAEAPAITGVIGGIGRFLHNEGNNTNALYASFDSPGLSLLRGELLTGLIEAGLIDAEQLHDFTPHITLAYIDVEQPTPDLEIGGIEISFDTVTLAWGDKRTAYPLQSGLAMKATDDTGSGSGYGARAGQVIRGRLARGGDGKFTAAGNASAKKPAAPKTPAKAPSKPAAKPSAKPAPAKRAARRAARAAAKPKAPAKGKAPAAKRPRSQQVVEAEAQRESNRFAVAKAMADSDTGLQPAAFQALTDFADGKAADPAMLKTLAGTGLVEQAEDGSFRLSVQGRTFMAAANAGDTRRALDAMSKGTDTVAKRQTAAEVRAQRAAEREERRAAAEAKKLAAGDKPAKGGGGGSKPKKDKAPAAQTSEETTDQYRDWAQRLSEGDDMWPHEVAALIRNGLAKYDNKDNLILTARGLRAIKPKAASKATGMQVFKDRTGRWRWLLISSSAYRDRDGEIVRRKALADDCARADVSGQYGPLRWWHVGQPDPLPGLSATPWGPGLDIGMCDFNAMSGPFLVESGTFNDERWGPIIQKAAPQLGGSIAFYHLPKDAENTYPHIQRFERSLLPRGKESNLFTRLLLSGGTPVEIDKVAALKELAGDEGDALLDTLLSQAEQMQKAAAGAGIAQKEAGAPDSGITIKAAAPDEEAGAIAEEAVEAEAESEETLAEVIFDDAERAEIRSIVEEVIQSAMATQAAQAAATTKALKALGVQISQIAEKGATTATLNSWDITTKALSDLKSEVAALQAKVKELDEDAPSAWQLPALRPSQSAANVIPSAVAASLKDAKPTPDPFAVLVDQIMPGA